MPPGTVPEGVAGAEKAEKADGEDNGDGENGEEPSRAVTRAWRRFWPMLTES
jgi:hypothetical protein